MTSTIAERTPAGRSSSPGPGPSRVQPPARAHPSVVWAVVVAGAVAVLALWWEDTPSLHGLGDWLTNAGRITGLLAGYGVVVLVALMARIPVLERGIGADQLALWHARGGRYTVTLIVAHAALITWGYAVSAHTGIVHQSSTLLLSYPDVMMATVAGALLVGVGLVSARAARRRMRYETWYYLHLYTYLAVALAFSHQFSTGADFVDKRAARAAWSALYLAVGVALLWYRAFVPLRQAFRHRMRVESVLVEGPGVVSVVVAGRRVEELRAEAGQFFRWRFLTRDLWWASNPYSLSAAPLPGRIRITAKDLGSHSAALHRVRPGTRVFAEGPYGALTAGRRRRDKVLLIAGGIGITPLRALLQTLPARVGDITLLYRVGADSDVVFRHEIEAIAKARGARVQFLVGHRRDLGHDPLSAASLAANIPALRDHDVFVCGPDAMAESAVAALRLAKVPRRQIHHESFTF